MFLRHVTPFIKFKSLFRMGSQDRLKAVVALGLVSEKPVEKLGSPLNTLSHHLAQLLTFEKRERDMLLMRHDVSPFLFVSTC